MDNLTLKYCTFLSELKCQIIKWSHTYVPSTVILCGKCKSIFHDGVEFFYTNVAKNVQVGNQTSGIIPESVRVMLQYFLTEYPDNL